MCEFNFFNLLPDEIKEKIIIDKSLSVYHPIYQQNLKKCIYKSSLYYQYKVNNLNTLNNNTKYEKVSVLDILCHCNCCNLHKYNMPEIHDLYFYKKEDKMKIMLNELYNCNRLTYECIHLATHLLLVCEEKNKFLTKIYRNEEYNKNNILKNKMEYYSNKSKNIVKLIKTTLFKMINQYYDTNISNSITNIYFIEIENKGNNLIHLFYNQQESMLNKFITNIINLNDRLISLYKNKKDINMIHCNCQCSKYIKNILLSFY